MLKNRAALTKTEEQEATLKVETSMFCTRIDDELRTKFKVHCAANKRSISDEMNAILKAYLEKHGEL